jgi:hypothetical protein
MESKNYTNIAGSPFQPYVKDQIELRKSIISKENRSTSDLLWLTNRNSWIRISSGTDVDSDNTNFPNEKGNILSKKYLLQAGLIDNTGGPNSYKLRSGIGPNGAYGIGGTEFGFKPMPGLENISIKTGGRLGTLREATFEFTCYNMEQLEIMNALYMKLGFSVLIEWGHIPFLDNKGTLNTNPIPLDFFSIKTKEELMTAIQKKRVYHSGNYDAMWGTIKNFSYSYGENGEFKCKVDLVGAGDILESLKINQSGNSGDIETETSEYPVVSDANKSLLNEALYFYYNNGISSATNPFILKSYLNTYFKKLNIKFEDFAQNTDLVKKGYHYSLLSKLNENNGGDKINIPDILYPELYFSNFYLDIEADGEDGETSTQRQIYMTLGHLLLLTLATGGVYDQKDSEENPYIYVDVNNETNRCYTFPGHCSLDPTVCLIGSEGLPFSVDSTIFYDLIKPSYPFYDSTNKELGGRFMWTLVNIDFIVKTLRKYTSSDTKGDVNFVDFAKDILTGISKACGGFNEFRIVPDDDTRCVRIFDDRVVPDFKYETAKYLTIPILGKNSIVYNFNYTSKISPQMATQIVIAAQAQDKGVKGNKNSLSFSHLNGGLTNRLSPTRVEAAEDSSSEKPDESTLSKYIELRDQLINIYNGVPAADLVTEEEIAATEEKLGVINTKEGNKELKETALKSLIEEYLQIVYQRLLNAAEGLQEEDKERERLVTAYNAVKKTIEEETDFSGQQIYWKKFVDGKDTGFILTNDKSLSLYIHNLLESEYDSVYTVKDTAIEAAWTKVAKDDTGLANAWY